MKNLFIILALFCVLIASPVNAATLDELQAQINELRALLIQLQSKTLSSPAVEASKETVIKVESVKTSQKNGVGKYTISYLITPNDGDINIPVSSSASLISPGETIGFSYKILGGEFDGKQTVDITCDKKVVFNNKEYCELKANKKSRIKVTVELITYKSDDYQVKFDKVNYLVNPPNSFKSETILNGISKKIHLKSSPRPKPDCQNTGAGSGARALSMCAASA